VAALDAAGASVWRTDVSGDVVVVVRDGELGVVARG
jgi:competence protein ComEC